MTAILPVAYLPPISWWAVALKYGRIDLEYHETYPKQTYRNRCYIYTANGPAQLTIPVVKTNGNRTKTLEIAIDNSRNWQQVHWRSIESAYNRSPYFLYYKDQLRFFYEKKFSLLAEYDLQLIKTVLRLLKGLELTVQPTIDFQKETAYPDFRLLLNPKVPVKSFWEVDFPRYIQSFETHSGFLPDLSILDLLFNEGPASVSYLRELTDSVPDLNAAMTDFPDIQS